MRDRVIATYAAIQRPATFQGPLPEPNADAFVVKIVPASSNYRRGADGKYPDAAFVPATLSHVDGRYSTFIHGQRLKQYGGDPARLRRVAAEVIKYADRVLDLAARLKCVNTQQRNKFRIYCPQTYIEIENQAKPWCLPCRPGDGAAGWAGCPSDYMVIGRSTDADGLDRWGAMSSIFHELGHASLGVGEPGAQWFSATAGTLLNREIEAGGVMKTSQTYTFATIDQHFHNSGIAMDTDDWQNHGGVPWNIYAHFHFWMYVSGLCGIEGVACMLDGANAAFPAAVAARRARGAAVGTGHVRWVEAFAIAAGTTPAAVLERYLRDVVPLGPDSAAPAGSPREWRWFAAGRLTGGRWTPTQRLEYHGFLVVDVGKFARGRTVRWSSSDGERFRVVAFVDGKARPGLVDGAFAVPASGSAWLAFTAAELPGVRTLDEVAASTRPGGTPTFVLEIR